MHNSANNAATNPHFPIVNLTGNIFLVFIFIFFGNFIKLYFFPMACRLSSPLVQTPLGLEVEWRGPLYFFSGF